MTIRTPPRVRRATEPWIDRTREMEWIARHEAEYRGEYVLLVGDQLVAHGRDLKAVTDEARAGGYDRPLVHFVPPDNLPFWSGIYE